MQLFCHVTDRILYLSTYNIIIELKKKKKHVPKF